MWQEIIPGFKFSRAAYLAGLLRPTIIKDLNLEKYGFKYLSRNPSSFTPTLESSIYKGKSTYEFFLFFLYWNPSFLFFVFFLFLCFTFLDLLFFVNFSLFLHTCEASFSNFIIKNFHLFVHFYLFNFNHSSIDESLLLFFNKGKFLLLGDDAKENWNSIAQFSVKDADAFVKYERFLGTEMNDIPFWNIIWFLVPTKSRYQWYFAYNRSAFKCRFFINRNLVVFLGEFAVPVAPTPGRH